MTARPPLLAPFAPMLDAVDDAVDALEGRVHALVAPLLSPLINPLDDVDLDFAEDDLLD